MRKAADLFMFQIMLILCITWGMQQIAIKLAAHDVATIVQASLRSGIAAFLLMILMFYKRNWQQYRATCKAGLLAGVCFTSEFLFIALGLQYTTAAHMAVFLYTAPVFSALGLHFLVPTERLTLFKWIGISVCFLGIVIAFWGGFSLQDLNSTLLIGDSLALLAGLSWGITTIVVRASCLSEAPVSLTLFYQLFIAFTLLLIIALATGQFNHFKLTAIAISSLLFQGVIVSFISYFIWFWLMQRYLANNLAVFSFMTPIFGVTFGVIILGEKISYDFIIGAFCILVGITLVSGKSLFRQFVERV